MRMKIFIAGTVILMSACVSSQAEPDAPAVITQPSAESRAELLAAVTSALGIANVLLADDALTKTSTLTIERSRVRDANGRQLSGRDLDKPEQFQLVKHGARCVLIHRSSAKRFELPKTTCERE